jgi:hypothetical protein
MVSLLSMALGLFVLIVSFIVYTCDKQLETLGCHTDRHYEICRMYENKIKRKKQIKKMRARRSSFISSY